MNEQSILSTANKIASIDGLMLPIQTKSGVTHLVLSQREFLSERKEDILKARLNLIKKQHGEDIEALYK